MSFWERLKKGEVRGLGTALALLAGVFGGLAPSLQKYALPAEFSPTAGESWGMVLSNPVFLLGAALGVISVFVLIVAYSYGKASTLFPLSGGTGYLTNLLTANLLLGEQFTLTKVLGVLIIFIGVSLLSKTVE